MRFGGIVLAAALLLGACSSDPAPKEPTATPSEPTASPTRALPTMPPQATEDSDEGAAAFVKHYVDVFNYAAATGDVEELTRLSSPDCEGCQSYIDLYQQTYAAGGYFRGGDWTIGEFSVRGGSGETYLTTSMHADSSLYRETKSSPEKRDPGEKSKLSFAVVRPSADWQVSQLGLGDVQ
jgi:hypothetical protein